MPQTEKETASIAPAVPTAPLQNLNGESRSPSTEPMSRTVDMNHWLSLLVMNAALLLLLLTVAVAVRLMAAVGHTLLLFSLGALLAYAFDPLVERMQGGRIDRRARTRNVLIVFLVVMVLLIVSLVLLSQETVRQVNSLVRDHVQIEMQARQKLADTDRWLAKRKIRVNLENYLDHPPANVRSWGEGVAQSVVRVVESIGQAAAEGIIVLLIALYFMIYGSELREKFNRALQPRVRAYAEFWEEDVNRILGRFVRGQLLLALVMGGLAGVCCLLLGVQLWLLIGMFVVVASLIPMIGPYIGAIPAVISSLLTPAGMLSPGTRTLILIVLFVLINEFGARILYPKLVGNALGLHEVLVLFILFAGFEAGGIVGALFAAPLTALSFVTLTHLYRLWQGMPPISLAAAVQKGAQEARLQE